MITFHGVKEREPSALLSACGKYRYLLTRPTGVAGPVLSWLMLNPSKAVADVKTNDPTIRKVIGFSARAGYGAIIVANLYAFRATDPRDVYDNLLHAEGEDNRQAIEYARYHSDAMVFAWGATPWAQAQSETVRGWIEEHDLGYERRSPLCIGGKRAKNGAPFHPLMQPYALGLHPFEARMS